MYFETGRQQAIHILKYVGASSSLSSKLYIVLTVGMLACHTKKKKVKQDNNIDRLDSGHRELINASIKENAD